MYCRRINFKVRERERATKRFILQKKSKSIHILFLFRSFSSQISLQKKKIDTHNNKKINEDKFNKTKKKVSDVTKIV